MRSRALIALVAALAATLALTGAARAAPSAEAAVPVSVRGDGLSRALARGAITEARYALERARALFHPAAVAARYGPLAEPDPRDATLVLRDLAVRLGQLSPAERALAGRILARPDDGASDPIGTGYAVPSRFDCTPDVCVHWVDTTADAPVPTDSDGDTIPDYVELTESVMEQVWSKEVVQYGYRAPKSDLSSADHGPDARIDVYLADVGDDGFYGYCTTDDPGLVPSYPYGDASAYCVLDNDFSPTQFPGPTTQTAALEVTAAHEFFHAVQFAYDIYEDDWLMEGTAVWMEDEVYDEVNDNYQYLRASALRHPTVPLDLGVDDFSSPLFGFKYGAFVFWRFLEETFTTPEVIRRVWELADDTPGAPNEYSLQAVQSMLEERGTSLGAAFALFGAVNVSPRSYYEEGGSYPTPPAARLASLTTARTAASGTVRLDHLTNWYAVLRPGANLRRNARLRIELDLPPSARGAEASLVVVSRQGVPRIIRVPLDQAGRATRTVSFARARVSSVVLVLTNASGRLDCWRSTDLSCHGTPLDERLPYSYSARVL